MIDVLHFQIREAADRVHFLSAEIAKGPPGQIEKTILANEEAIYALELLQKLCARNDLRSAKYISAKAAALNADRIARNIWKKLPKTPDLQRVKATVVALQENALDSQNDLIRATEAIFWANVHRNSNQPEAKKEARKAIECYRAVANRPIEHIQFDRGLVPSEHRDSFDRAREVLLNIREAAKNSLQIQKFLLYSKL